MDNEFIRIYHLYKNDVLRLAYSYIKNLSDAEDITQEVFIKLYDNFNKFSDDEYMRKWCFRVTINKCKNLLLSSWHKKISFITQKEENTISGERDDSNDIMTALFKLSPRYRMVIILHYYNGYKVKEIANILKVKESLVKTRLKRGREKLQEIIEKEII